MQLPRANQATKSRCNRLPEGPQQLVVLYSTRTRLECSWL